MGKEIYSTLRQATPVPPTPFLPKPCIMLSPQAVGDLPDLQDPVARLCCSWWELQAPGRDNLMAQTLPYILVREGLGS